MQEPDVIWFVLCASDECNVRTIGPFPSYDLAALEDDVAGDCTNAHLTTRQVPDFTKQPFIGEPFLFYKNPGTLADERVWSEKWRDAYHKNAQEFSENGGRFQSQKMLWHQTYGLTEEELQPAFPE